MLMVWGTKHGFGDGITRRAFLHIGCGANLTRGDMLHNLNNDAGRPANVRGDRVQVRPWIFQVNSSLPTEEKG